MHWHTLCHDRCGSDSLKESSRENRNPATPVLAEPAIIGIGRQDLIVQTPAPAALGLFGLGLGLVALRRTRV